MSERDNNRDDDTGYRPQSDRQEFNWKAKAGEYAVFGLRKTGAALQWASMGLWKLGGAATKAATPWAKKGGVAATNVAGNLVFVPENPDKKRFMGIPEVNRPFRAIFGAAATVGAFTTFGWIPAIGFGATAAVWTLFNGKAAAATLFGLSAMWHAPRAAIYGSTVDRTTFYSTGQNDDGVKRDGQRYIVRGYEIKDFPDVDISSPEANDALRDAALNVTTATRNMEEFEIEYSFFFPMQWDPDENQWGSIPTESAICQADVFSMRNRWIKQLPVLGRTGIAEALTLRRNISGNVQCRPLPSILAQ